MARVVFRDARIYLIQWLTKILTLLARDNLLIQTKSICAKLTRDVLADAAYYFCKNGVFTLRYFSFSAEYTAVSSSANKPPVRMQNRSIKMTCN